MAKKSEKDLKIENLENKVKNLEEEKNSRIRWKSIPNELQIALTVTAVLLLFSMVLYFYLEIKRSMEIGTITEDDYQRVAMVMDNTDWKTSKSGFTEFKKIFNDKKLDGTAHIDIVDDDIELLIDGEDYSYFGVFSYYDGYIVGFIAGRGMQGSSSLKAS